MLIINKLNKDTTMTTMAYIELLAEQKAHEQWIKDQVEWNKQNETRNKSYKMNISIFQIKCMKIELAKPNIILWKNVK